MSSDDLFFLGYLSSVPNHIWHYSQQVTDSVERNVERAADGIKDALADQSWIPASIRPIGPSSASVASASQADDSQSTANMLLTATGLTWVGPRRLQTLVRQYPKLSASALAFLSTGVVLLCLNQLSHGRKKRGAKRASNGARKEIVVIAGSPRDALTRCVALDLERRGFIVFVTVSSHEDENVLHSERREDIRSLWLDHSATPDSTADIHPSLAALRSLITVPQSPMQGVPPHLCQLTGLILIPPRRYPVGPLDTISPPEWADSINSHVLSPILTTRSVLPLLTLQPNPSSIVLLAPSISSSLSAPFDTPEATSVGAVSSFLSSLRRQLRVLEPSPGHHTDSIDVVELRLGNIDLGRQFRDLSSGASSTSSPTRQRNAAAASVNGGHVPGTEVLTWTPQQRTLYGSSYLGSLSSSQNPLMRGSPVRTLHHAVYDALVPSPKSLLSLPGRHGRGRGNGNGDGGNGGDASSSSGGDRLHRQSKAEQVYVGRGAQTYALIGNMIPSCVIGWMFGMPGGILPRWLSSSSSPSPPPPSPPAANANANFTSHDDKDGMSSLSRSVSSSEGWEKLS